MNSKDRTYIQNDPILPFLIGGKPFLFTFSSGKQAMTANGSALLRYTMIMSVQKLAQVIKSNTE